MDVVILSIGTELTLGQTVDTNSAWLSSRLAAIGVRVTAHVTVPDELEPIHEQMRRACERADVVLITGGLGPTADDLTRHALAALLGTDLVLHEDMLEQIRRFFAGRHREMPEANAIQAMFPRGAEPIENTCGTAPGMRATWGRATLYMMPGVPREMQVMFERDVAPALRDEANGATGLGSVLWCYGAGESDVGDALRDLMQRGRNPSVGTTAQHTVIGVRIHACGPTRREAEELLQATADEVRRRLGILVFGEGEETLAHAVVRLLIEQHKTIATAESCTGGLIATSLTDIPGSSACFLDGVATYSNEAKQRLLGVSGELIGRHGAVSAEVAEAMAVNCRRLSGSDLAVSVTGIAGPTGGTPDKPVGLVHVGLADEHGCEVTRHFLGEALTREEVRDRSRKIALNRVRLRLLHVPDHR